MQNVSALGTGLWFMLGCDYDTIMCSHRGVASIFLIIATARVLPKELFRLSAWPR